MGGEITHQIKKKAETTGELKVYIYLILDAQLSIWNEALISAIHKENVMHFALGSLEREYLGYFDFVITANISDFELILTSFQ